MGRGARTDGWIGPLAPIGWPQAFKILTYFRKATRGFIQIGECKNCRRWFVRELDAISEPLGVFCESADVDATRGRSFVRL